MDLSEAGQANGFVGRNEAFGQGSAGAPYRVANSLQQDSAIWNDSVGSGFTPQSVLNQTVASGNGMSSGDYSSRELSNGSMLPTQNGMSADTRTGIAKILLDGMRQVGTL